MKIIAGLGNPGAAYRNTPHSVGFEVLDAFAAEIGAVWEEKKAFKAMLAAGAAGGERILLVKPQTFMNLSGESLQPVVKYHNAVAKDLLVVHDDIDLPLGRMRFRKNGSAGGHNGVKNIIERLGSREFNRLKLGVGKDPSNVIAHVLGKFSPAARAVADVAVADAVKAIGVWLSFGPDRAMNEYNGYQAGV